MKLFSRTSDVVVNLETGDPPVSSRRLDTVNFYDKLSQWGTAQNSYKFPEYILNRAMAPGWRHEYNYRKAFNSTQSISWISRIVVFFQILTEVLRVIIDNTYYRDSLSLQGKSLLYPSLTPSFSLLCRTQLSRSKIRLAHKRSREREETKTILCDYI